MSAVHKRRLHVVSVSIVCSHCDAHWMWAACRWLVKGFKYFSQFHDYNEIGEVLAARDPGRRSDEQRIIDYNYGLALHDVVFASKIYELVKDMAIPSIDIIKETEKFWI